MFSLKTEYEEELGISKLNLLHSTTADGKKELRRRKLFLALNWGMTKFWLFVWYELLFEGIKSNKYFGGCSLTIL